ncbi:hypothetical protein B0H17DRAFT_1137821 [Mycena rosella]|uniref:Uncharacterized protein n=1 Tax=Mycena rosella TaxID=1033263 RepID=A0AAD7D7L5_MYCRO|nr:hypothetical protein B0H17DRAFT_1137821 [Mycena rosella]
MHSSSISSAMRSTRSKMRWHSSCNLQAVQMGAATTSQQILIAALPPMLMLHVKHFYYDAVAGVVKLAKHMVFGPELEIRNKMLAPPVTMRKPVRYKLFVANSSSAAVYHHRVSAAYTLDVLHVTRGWVRPTMSSSSCQTCRPVHVPWLGAGGGMGRGGQWAGCWGATGVFVREFIEEKGGRELGAGAKWVEGNGKGKGCMEQEREGGGGRAQGARPDWGV